MYNFILSQYRNIKKGIVKIVTGEKAKLKTIQTKLE